MVRLLRLLDSRRPGAHFTFGINYGTTHLGMSRTSMLIVSVLCSLLAIAGLRPAGRLSDK
ncbi:hypothetical protein [Nocardia jinanensis]|uniref:hypothetical protein n=1 Tax=Nocardia jinanensis TaxID=382504 RepID=UPI000B08917B|nr:hypothetical protein [Nocardia jinanensis]